MVPKPIIEIVIPIVEVLNIWAILVDEQAEQTEEDRREGRKKTQKIGKRIELLRRPDIIAASMVSTKRWLVDLVD